MTQAKSGDQVRVHYTGKFENGDVFDSSVGGESLQFTIGAGQLIPGFDHAVVGMTPGETKTVLIAAEHAYGPYKDELVVTVERKNLPAHITPEIGRRYRVRQPSGTDVVVTVTALSEGSVTMDANHALAGKDLTFEIQLVEIV
ncbi:MAG: peptidylprolyl isomerase [Candidatus Binatia bacterium]